MSRPRCTAVCNVPIAQPPPAETCLELRQVSTLSEEQSLYHFGKVVISIAAESRMKEITGNLKQDVKDLLGESGSLFTGFFKRGVCTVRAVADKWKAFAHDISGTVDELMKPPFAEGGPEAPAPLLNSKDEPMVTVVESTDEHFPEKLQMPLSQAERRILQIGELYRAHNQEPQPVKVKIDYMKNGQTDRYFLPLQIGAGGSLLTQMREHIGSYQVNQEKISQLFHSVPDEYRAFLQNELTPFLHNSLDGLSKELLPYFQWHCGVGELGRQLEEQADMLPENERASFRSGVREALDGLRQSINLGAIPEPPALYREQPGQQVTGPIEAPAKAPHQSREPIKVRLQQLQKGEQKVPPLPQHELNRPAKIKYHSWIKTQEARKRSAPEHKVRQPKSRKRPER